MGILRLLGLGKKDRSLTQRSANPFDESFWRGVSTASRSGVAVNPTTAVQVAAVNAAVRLLSETIASLPLILYRRLPDGGRERAYDHPLYSILHSSPNNWMTRLEWMEIMVRHLLLRGNGYSQIVEQAGEIVALNPLHPDMMTVSWSKDQKRVVYRYHANGRTTAFLADQILHFRGPTDDGLLGKSPIQEAKDVIGNALALDQYQSYFYANGVRTSGVLEHPGALTDETAKRISESFASAYSGASNSGKVVVLEEGMKFSTVSVSPKDAEFLAVRKFSVAEIARIFRVPPHMIGDLENATFSNIEHEGISFVVHSIRPTTVRLEQAIDKSLLAGDSKEEYFVEFLLDGLLRGDTAARFAAYQIGLQNGIYKFNDVCRMENLNPLPWGEATMVPLNMKIISSKEDLKADPAAAPAKEDLLEEDKTEEGAEPESKQDLFWYQAESFTRAFRPSFERAFQMAAGREQLVADTEYKDLSEFDTKVRKLLSGHHSYMRSNLEPIIQAFSSQIICIAGIYQQRNAPLESTFVADYINEYVGKRFDEIWALAADRSTIIAWAEGLKRNARKSEARELMQKILSAVLLTEGETK